MGAGRRGERCDQRHHFITVRDQSSYIRNAYSRTLQYCTVLYSTVLPVQYCVSTEYLGTTVGVPTVRDSKLRALTSASFRRRNVIGKERSR